MAALISFAFCWQPSALQKMLVELTAPLISFFASKLDHCIVGAICFMCYKLSSLTGRLGKQVKTKFGKIDSTIIDTPNIQFGSCDINVKWFGKRECMKSPTFPLAHFQGGGRRDINFSQKDIK